MSTNPLNDRLVVQNFLLNTFIYLKITVYSITAVYSSIQKNTIKLLPVTVALVN